MMAEPMRMSVSDSDLKRLLSDRLFQNAKRCGKVVYIWKLRKLVHPVETKAIPEKRTLYGRGFLWILRSYPHR